MMKHLKLLFGLLFCCLLSQAKMATDTPSLSCYPNPFSDKFTLSIESNAAQVVTIKFVNSFGTTLYTEMVAISKGVNNLSYGLPNQPEGIYYVMMSGQNWSRNQRVVYMKPAPSRSDSIDIVHYDISLSIQNLVSKTISGTTIVTIDPKQVDSLTTIKLDLLKLNVTDVKVNSITTSFSKNDSELYVVINRKNSTGNDSLINVAITYSGQPVSDPQWGGFYFNGNYAYNMGVAFKSVPHNFGRCWFPCIDNFTDRSTYTFHITTDPTFKAVCNGLMLPEMVNGDGSTTWNWEIKQPIPTYLASVAVGKYEFIKYDFQGINRTYPVWLAVVAADTTKAKTSFAKLNNALQCFESKYGAYPFDRIGYVGVPFNSGAMEHATNIAYPNYAVNGNTDYETLFAHELSHMWWGDLATCRTPEDMWLNEGWASFNEALFLECVYGKNAYINDIKAKSKEVLLSAPKTDGGWYPVSGIPQNITYGTHVYKKGALMVHSLRALMGDSAFFLACKSYLTKYHFADVSSDDLKNEFQKFTSIDLNNVFQKWIYSPGHSDIVIDHYAVTGSSGHGQDQTTTYTFTIIELQRKHTIISSELPFTFTYEIHGNPYIRREKLINGKATINITLRGAVGLGRCYINHDYAQLIKYYTPDSISFNKNNDVWLGKTYQQLDTFNQGTLNMPDVLLSLNVKGWPTPLFITHHWVGPTQGNIKKTGIRISEERYWSIDANGTDSLKAWAFFDYNGTASSYLDSELINKTEDSLVLLYRVNLNEEWQIHTDNTFQPGPSKTDKVGRFWVNNLKTGEYAFGMRDGSVVGLENIQPVSKQTNSFIIIPNPSGAGDQWITLQFKDAVRLNEIQILNAKGVVLKDLLVNKTLSTHELSVGDLPSGNYFIVVKTPSGNISHQFIRK